MPRPIFVAINTAALRHNLDQLRTYAPGAKCFAVVKANAYGHGIERAYPALCTADGFATLDLTEAEQLRNLGYTGPILLLEGTFSARDLVCCSRLRLWHTVHQERQIDWLAEHTTDTPHHIFLKLNSGMNRLGFTPQHYRKAYMRLCSLPQVGEISHMQHFATANQPHGIAKALRYFEAATQNFSGKKSLSNSSSLLLHGQQLGEDWLRLGIALYGASPDYPNHIATSWGLRPAMSLKSRIIATQWVRTGQGVGYDFAFHAERDLPIGIVACGYADGYPRQAPNGTPVLVQGTRTRLLGRVSMDMLAVDLSELQHLPQEGLGSEVCLWGRAHNGVVLDVDEVAQAANNLGYALLTGITPRVPFVLENESERSNNLM